MCIMVRAKFKCESAEGNGRAVLRAVYGPENEPWSTATPHGELQITITNPDAQKFEVGKCYYLDFSLAE